MKKKVHHSFIYLIVIGLTGEFVSSQVNSDEERFCEAAVQCPDYEATQYRMMASFLPICYCDNLCTAYNDCCKLKASYPKSEQLQELQRLRYNGDPKSFSTCLGLDGENIGFWAVNRCGSEGPICTTNMSFANVLSHLPVTDNDNVTYFGEDCAKCNNVTSFDRWEILIGNYRHEENGIDADPLHFVNRVKNGNFSLRQGQDFDMYLTPPRNASIRVCYRFKGDTLSNSTQCPDFHVPIITDYRQDGKNTDIYKNLECCKAAGACKVLKRDGCIHKLQYSNVRIFAPSTYDAIKNPRSSLETPGVLLQFNGNANHCHNKNKCSRGCHEQDGRYHDECSGSIKLFNYPLPIHFIKFVLREPKNDNSITGSLLTPLFTFFFNSKWRIKLFGRFFVDMKEGTQCLDNMKRCATVETSFQSFASTSLTVREIGDLKSWMDNMNVTIHLRMQSQLLKVSGSLSTESINHINCSCNEYQELETQSFDFSWFPYEMYKIRWSDAFYKCTHFKFLVIERVKSVKVSCIDKSATNGFKHIQEHIYTSKYSIFTVLYTIYIQIL